MQSKPWFKSVTFWGLFVTIIGLLVSGVGKGEPIMGVFADPAVQEVLGQILLTVGLGGAFYGRARAKTAVTLRKPRKPRKAKTWLDSGDGK